MRLALFFAAIPALLGSVFLMHSSGVSSVLIWQQLLVFLVPSLVLWLATRHRHLFPTNKTAQFRSLILAACLFLPLIIDRAEGPQRWLNIGPLRLYLAPILLPTLMLYLEVIRREMQTKAIWLSLPVFAASAALVLQPDAAQMSAFACSCIPIVLASEMAKPLRAIVTLSLLVCVFAVWQIPDPLEPVAHVEGVFHLAAQSSPFELIFALVAAALPSAVLILCAWTSSSVGLFAVGIYYAAILSLSPLKITPVPLLGFGAGPIFGYVFLTFAISAFSTKKPAMRPAMPIRENS